MNCFDHYTQGWNVKEARSLSDIDDESRLKRAGTKVLTTKAWVRFKKDICYWPSVVYIRRPFNSSGAEFLKEEKCIYFEPFGEKKSFLKPFIDGGWSDAAKIRPFADKHDKKRESGLQHKTKIIRDMFTTAMILCNRSDVPSVHFEFEGNSTYECSDLNKQTAAAKAACRVTPCPDVASMFGPRCRVTEQMIREVNLCISSMSHSQFLQMEIEKEKAILGQKRSSDMSTEEVVSSDIDTSSIMQNINKKHKHSKDTHSHSHTHIPDTASSIKDPASRRIFTTHKMIRMCDLANPLTSTTTSASAIPTVATANGGTGEPMGIPTTTTRTKTSPRNQLPLFSSSSSSSSSHSNSMPLPSPHHRQKVTPKKYHEPPPIKLTRTTITTRTPLDKNNNKKKKKK